MGSGRATYMMTFRRGSLGLVAIFGLFSMAAASPWFYHGLEGPSFTEKNQTSSGLEIRSYPESYWTATTVTGKNMDSAGSEAFMRLFRYISGDNERNEKIEMTVPVLASVVPGQGPFLRGELHVPLLPAQEVPVQSAQAVRPEGHER